MIGLKIKTARKSLGMSQKQLAGDEMSRAYVSIIESGKVIPSQKLLGIISNRLGKPLSYFLGESGEDNDEICYAILHRVSSSIDAYSFKTAQNLLNKVLNMSHDENILSETYLLYFNLLLDNEKYHDVLNLAEHAIDICKNNVDKSHSIKLHMSIAKAHFRVEGFKSAQKHYILALDYGRNLKKCHYEKIQCHIYLGTTLLRLGVISDAIINYRIAISETELTSFYDLQANALYGLGKALFLNNQLNEALEATKDSLKIFETLNNEEWKNSALKNLLIMSHSLEDADKAYNRLQTLYDFYASSNNIIKQASLIEEFAIYQVKFSDYSKAKELCIKGLKLLDTKDDAILRGNFYRILGIIENLSGNQDNCYLFVRMSFDLYSKINSIKEADISMELLKNIESIDIKERFLALIQRT